jgi:Uma2 family endonuclease
MNVFINLYSIIIVFKDFASIMTSIIIDPNNLKKGKDDWKVHFTYNDLQSLPTYSESPLIEIIKGELYVVPSPVPNHQRISRNLEFLLVEFFKVNNLGEVFDAPIDLLLSDEDVVIPDLVVVSKTKTHIITDKNISGTPDLVIEILSTNKHHDLVKKKALYEFYHVPEYWIIDPIEQSLEVYFFKTEQDSKYTVNQKLFNNDTVVSKVFPGLKVNLNEIFPLRIL